MAWMMPFGRRTCRDAARIAINFFERAGTCRPIPRRAKALIEELNVERFWWRPATMESRIEMCDRIKAAVGPWTG